MNNDMKSHLNIKGNLPLIIGIGLPIVLILVLFFFVIKPAQKVDVIGEFVFSAGKTHLVSFDGRTEYILQYKLVNNQIVLDITASYAGKGNIQGSIKPIPINQSSLPAYIREDLEHLSPALLSYNFKENSVTTWTLLGLNSRLKDYGYVSKDLYEFDRKRSNDGIFEIFGGGRNYNTFYLYKNGVPVMEIPKLNTYATNDTFAGLRAVPSSGNVVNDSNQFNVYSEPTVQILIWLKDNNEAKNN